MLHVTVLFTIHLLSRMAARLYLFLDPFSPSLSFLVFLSALFSHLS